MSSITEAKPVALYIMVREAVYIHIILGKRGHKQQLTPTQTDNAMTDAVINGKCNPKVVRQRMPTREWQQQFRFFWCPGKNKLR